MRNIIYIAYYTLIQRIRDYKSLGYMLLQPILLILILGTALNSTFQPDALGVTSVCLLDKDQGEEARYFIEYLNRDEIKKLLNVTTVKSHEEGILLINDKKMKAAAIIEIPEGFTKNAHSGSKANIEIYSSRYGDFRISIVQNIVSSYMNGRNLFEITKETLSDKDFKNNKNINELPISVSGKTPRAIDYYAVTMLVMILMYGALYSLHGIAEDYLEPVGQRIRSLPIKPYHNYIGKTIGFVLTIFWQSVVLIVFTKYVFKVNWGNRLSQILLISFLFCIFAIALGIMVMVLVKERTVASGLLNIIIPLLTFLAGGYVKLDMGLLSYLSPNYLAQTAIFNTIYGGSASQSMSYLAMLCGLTVIMFAIASIAGRRNAV